MGNPFKKSIFELFFTNSVYTLVQHTAHSTVRLKFTSLYARFDICVKPEITGREVRAVGWVWQDLNMKFLQIRLHHCRTGELVYYHREIWSFGSRPSDALPDSGNQWQKEQSHGKMSLLHYTETRATIPSLSKNRLYITLLTLLLRQAATGRSLFSPTHNLFNLLSC